MVEREIAKLLADAQRHLEEASAYARNDDDSRRRHWEAIGAAKRALSGALVLMQARRAA